MIAYCKVMIDSPLPQLGREFDYKVPSGESLVVGQPVTVPFGRQSKPKIAVVTELLEQSDYATAEIKEVLGPPVLSGTFLQYIKSLAKRQAISPGELLRLSLTSKPKRRSDFLDEIDDVPEWVLETLGGRIELDSHLSEMVSAKQSLLSGSLHPHWAITALRSALSVEGSVIINTPDHRYQLRLRRLLDELEISQSFYWADDYKTPVRRYWLQQRLLKQGGILIGSRSVMMMDVKDLDRIVLINDLDPSHESEASPYLATRELSFIRAEAQGGMVHVIAHTPSAELLRLAELGYIKTKSNTDVPRISFGSETQISTSKLIAEAIKTGPVLILTSFSGDSAAISCKRCRSSGACQKCGGAIYMPGVETYRCRTCANMEKPICVSCGSNEFNKGGKGATRKAADFGKIIPGARVIESSQSKQVDSVSSKAVVVATPGAIPIAQDGYRLVVIDQPQSFLSRESLRALEHSLRIWTDAASHLSPDGQLHFANYEGDVVKRLSIGQFADLIRKETLQRKELGLSPWRRLGIVEGDGSRLNEIADSIQAVDVISSNPRLVFTYQYKDGPKVAEQLLREQLATPPLEGERRKRGLRVIMDGQGLI